MRDEAPAIANTVSALDLIAEIGRLRSENDKTRAVLQIANDALAKFCSHQLGHAEAYRELGAAWKETRRALKQGAS